MRKFYIILFLGVIFCTNSKSAFCEQNFPADAVSIYNSGAILQKQGKYALAEQKYAQVLRLQPDFYEAKKNLAIIYYDKAFDLCERGNYSTAVENAKKALSFNPKKLEVYEVLAKSYTNLGKYPEAISAYGKILANRPNDEVILHSTAEAYVRMKRFDKAAEIYQKLLQLNPSDRIAAQNLKFTKFQITEKSTNENINSLNSAQIVHNSPKELYALIKAGANKAYLPKMQSVLDLIWQDSSGKILLETVMEEKIPIVLTNWNSGAEVTTQRSNDTMFLDGFEDTNAQNFSSFSGEIKFPVKLILDFYNPNLTSYQRIYCLHAFAHEFCHAFINVKNGGNNNSLEEEIGASMIGYNIANKAISGRYLTQAQTKKYSRAIFASLMKDDHRDLPLYSGFTQKMQSFGVEMPYPYVYDDISQLYSEIKQVAAKD